MEDPHAISEQLRKMAFVYGEYAREFGKLKKNRAVEWLGIKKAENCTNSEADMRWDASEKGQRYHELKAFMDGLSKQMSAEKAHLRVLDVFGN